MSLENLIIFFVFASIFGWIFEVIIRYPRLKRLENRGVLLGSYLPFYGFGALLAIFILSLDIGFLIKMILFLFSVTFLELMTGVFFLNRGRRLWDYSDNILNYRGVVSLKVSFFWLLCFLLFYHVIYLNSVEILSFVYAYNLIYLAYFVLVVMFVDWLVVINKFLSRDYVNR